MIQPKSVSSGEAGLSASVAADLAAARAARLQQGHGPATPASLSASTAAPSVATASTAHTQ